MSLWDYFSCPEYWLCTWGAVALSIVDQEAVYLEVAVEVTAMLLVHLLVHPHPPVGYLQKREGQVISGRLVTMWTNRGNKTA